MDRKSNQSDGTESGGTTGENGLFSPETIEPGRTSGDGVRRGRGRPKKSGIGGPESGPEPVQDLVEGLEGKTPKKAKAGAVISESDIVKLGLFIFSNLATIRGPHWSPNIQALELMAGPLSNRLEKLPKGAKQKIDDATDIIFLALGSFMLLANPIKTEIALISQLGKPKNNEQTFRNFSQTNNAQSNGKPAGAEPRTAVPGVSSGLSGSGDRD